MVLSAANANDATMFEAVLDDIPPIRMPPAAAGAGPPRSTATKPTIIAVAGGICGGVASAHGSPGA